MRQKLSPLAVIASALVLFPWGAFADSLSLNQVIESHDVVIVGERHRKQESTQWFTWVVSDYVKNGSCLQVALEIGSDQQPTLDAAMKGNAPISSIQISPIIDHPSYRNMLTGFSEMTEAGKCLSLHAINAPLGVSKNRDEWMAARIETLNGEAPILVLVGNLHALKQVNWYQDVQGKDFLAERLQSDGIDVFSVLQYWHPESCANRSARLIAVSESRAYGVLSHVLEPVAADLPEKPLGVFDAAKVWGCEKRGR